MSEPTIGFTQKRGPWLLVGAYVMLAILLVPVYAHFPSPNEFTRWVLAAALVERQSVEVTPEAAMLGPAFEDLAVLHGRTYSNKSPGLALLVLPAYLTVRLFCGPADPTNIRWFLYAMRLLGSTLPLVLLAFCFLRCGRELGINRGRVATVTFALLFATPLFTYGLLLFSHALVAACLFGAWMLVFMDPHRHAGAADVIAGALMGLAVLSEYTAAASVLILVAGAVASRRWGCLSRIIAGGLPFAVILGTYQKVAFGGFFRLSSGFEKFPQFREVARTGFFGIGLPSPARLLHLLVDPSKGLLLFSPFLVLVPLAWPTVRRRFDLPAVATLTGVPLITFLSIAGYANWHGGWTVGPRYLLQALPFLLFFLLFLERSRFEDILLGFGTVAVVLTSIVFPFVPGEFPLPWGTFALALLHGGSVIPNILGIHGLAAVVLYSIVVLASAKAVFSKGRMLFFGVGVAVALLAGFVALQTLSSPRLRVERAYIADVYLCRPGSLEAVFPPGMTIPRSLQNRRVYELTVPPFTCPPVSMIGVSAPGSSPVPRRSRTGQKKWNHSGGQDFAAGSSPEATGAAMVLARASRKMGCE